MRKSYFLTIQNEPLRSDDSLCQQPLLFSFPVESQGRSYFSVSSVWIIKENTFTLFYVFIEKNPAYKWTHTVQSHAVRGSNVTKIRRRAKNFKYFLCARNWDFQAFWLSTLAMNWTKSYALCNPLSSNSRQYSLCHCHTWHVWVWFLPLDASLPLQVLVNP